MEDTDSTGAVDGVDMAPAAAGSTAAGVGVVAAAVEPGGTGAVELKRRDGSWEIILIDGLEAVRAKALLAIWEAWYAVEVENYEAIRCCADVWPWSEGCRTDLWESSSKHFRPVPMALFDKCRPREGIMVVGFRG